jgi:hypothetical protein
LHDLQALAGHDELLKVMKARIPTREVDAVRSSTAFQGWDPSPGYVKEVIWTAGVDDQDLHIFP